ncbi:hypothetical protein FOZ62_029095, partial [Perkinsus olseni]
TSPYLSMATILTLLFSALVTTVSADRFDYQYSFDNYRFTFGFDPSSRISDVKIKTECLIPSGPHAGTPYSTTTFTFPIEDGDCFHYFLMTPKAENAFETYRALLNDSCGLSLHEEAFHDYFQFSGFVVINIDQSHQVYLKPMELLEAKGLPNVHWAGSGSSSLTSVSR